ncbi:MAG: hypothetical protein HN501_02255 [Waddliaceae bacterium]|nr:hypothetical protein [Waddliaceae bacterium]
MVLFSSCFFVKGCNKGCNAVSPHLASVDPGADPGVDPGVAPDDAPSVSKIDLIQQKIASPEQPQKLDSVSLKDVGVHVTEVQAHEEPKKESIQAIIQVARATDVVEKIIDPASSEGAGADLAISARSVGLDTDSATDSGLKKIDSRSPAEIAEPSQQEFDVENLLNEMKKIYDLIMLCDKDCKVDIDDQMSLYKEDGVIKVLEELVRVLEFKDPKQKKKIEQEGLGDFIQALLTLQRVDYFFNLGLKGPSLGEIEGVDFIIFKDEEIRETACLGRTKDGFLLYNRFIKGIVDLRLLLRYNKKVNRILCIMLAFLLKRQELVLNAETASILVHLVTASQEEWQCQINKNLLLKELITLEKIFEDPKTLDRPSLELETGPFRRINERLKEQIISAFKDILKATSLDNLFQ